jgi:hypothetical protein
MRLAAICSLMLVPAAFAEGITIVLDFEGPKSDQSIAEMKREFAGIMKDAAVTVDWKSRAEAERLAFPNLMVVRFKGTCVLRPVPYLIDERGPMAFTYTTDGEVQPFSEVKCDEVSRVVRSAMSGSDYVHADLLMGRALGRVLAHEVVHIMSKSGTHGHAGVAKSALSARQLIGAELRLEPDDLDRIRQDR